VYVGVILVVEEATGTLPANTVSPLAGYAFDPSDDVGAVDEVVNAPTSTVINGPSHG